MKKITCATLAGLTLLMSSWAIADITPIKSDATLFADFKTALHNAPLLYAQNSNGASITPIPNKPGFYKLVLTDTSNYMAYFSDRPKTIAGVVPIAALVNSWNKGPDSFNQSPPNAAFHGISADEASQQGSYIFKLTDVSYDSANKSLSFDAQLIAGSQMLTNFGNNALFIDFTWNNSTP